MSKPHPFNLEEYKIQASILLKSLRSTESTVANKAAKRFQLLPEFKGLSANEIILAGIQRKHALAVIALENGFQSWNDLKTQIKLIIGGFLNKWFSTYADAKSHLDSAGGYLFPFKRHF